MKHFGIASQRGFTLVELLVAIAVIAMLAGLFFPALNMIRQKSWDTAARELCVQTVNGWEQLLITHRRFPDPELISYCAKLDADAVGVAAEIGDDWYFPMNKGTASLLNWWKPTHPLPVFDKENYVSWSAKAARGAAINVNDRTQIEDWPNDLILERSVEQKQWGLIAPWAARYVKGLPAGASAPPEVKQSTVWVMLDTSGDGKVTLPASLGAVALGADGNPMTLPKSVVAWVRSGPEEGSKFITSW